MFNVFHACRKGRPNTLWYYAMRLWQHHENHYLYSNQIKGFRMLWIHKYINNGFVSLFVSLFSATINNTPILSENLAVKQPLSKSLRNASQFMYKHVTRYRHAGEYNKLWHKSWWANLFYCAKNNLPFPSNVFQKHCNDRSNKQV